MTCDILPPCPCCGEASCHEYDPIAETLVCESCGAPGARPTGIVITSRGLRRMVAAGHGDLTPMRLAMLMRSRSWSAVVFATVAGGDA